MKFNNVVLYCKGWYQNRQGGVRTMWMDMAHCIDADGWTVWTEHDVARWCLFRLDDLRNDPLFENKSQLDLSRFMSAIYDNIRRAKQWCNEDISLDTAIILGYHNIISDCERSCFSEGVKPNKNILPLHYQEAYYIDGKYNPEHKPKFYPAEMDCDYQKKVNKMFSDYKEQDIDDNRFELVEGRLKIKNINDVLVLVGTDSLLDCVELNVTGKEIISGTFEDDILEKNIYNGAEIDPYKNYIIRATYDQFKYIDGGVYKIKSIREVIF